MQSLKKRLADRKEEFLEFVGDFGRHSAMGEYDIHCYSSLENLLKDWTGDKDYGKYPKFAGVFDGDWPALLKDFNDAVESCKANFNKRLSEMAGELDRVKEENKLLKRLVFRGFGKELVVAIETLRGNHIGGKF